MNKYKKTKDKFVNKKFTLANINCKDIAQVIKALINEVIELKYKKNKPPNTIIIIIKPIMIF